MNHQQVLQLGIAVALIMVFSVGCGSAAPAPVAEATAARPGQTAAIPTVTPTPAPTQTAMPTETPEPTSTPTSSVVGIGQTVETGPWKFTVTQLSQQTNVEDSFSRFKPNEGYVVQVVGNKIENTANMTNSLEVNLKQLAIIDREGESHFPIGVGVGEPSETLVTIFGTKQSGSISVSLGGMQVTFHLAIDEESRILQVEVPARSEALVTFAFTVPTDSDNLRLQWLDLPPISLGNDSAP